MKEFKPNSRSESMPGGKGEHTKDGHLLNAILRTVPEGMGVVDQNLNILWMNDRFLKRFGKKAMGKKCYEIFKDDRKQCSGCPLKKPIKLNETKTFITGPCAGGRIFEVTHTGMMFHEKKAILETFHDMTEEKRANAKLKESMHRASETLEFNELILNTSSVGIVTYKSSGKCTFANKAAAKAVGTTPAGLMAQNFHKIKSWKKSNMYKTALRALRSNSEQQLEVHARTSFGKDVWMRIRFSHFILRGERHLLLFLSDISEDKRNQEALAESEERYWSIFNNSGNCIAVYAAVEGGKNFIITGFNAAAEKVENIRREKVLGCKVTKVFPGVVEFGIFDVFKRVWKTGKPEHFPAKIYKDQRIAGWRDNYIYKLGSGEVVAIYKDVTNEKQAEGALRMAEERYRTIVESAADQIFTVDRNNRIISANKRMAELFGRAQAEVLGKNLSEIFPEETASKLSKNCRHVFNSGMGISTEERMYLEGREFYISTSLNPVRDIRGHVAAVVGIVRNITTIKKVEEDLKESEAHYKSLFNNSTTAVLEEDLSEVKKYLDRLRGRGIFDFRGYFAKHPEEVGACAKKARVIDVNLATIKSLESKSKEATKSMIQKLLAEGLSKAFMEQIIHLHKKRTSFKTEITLKTVKGKTIYAIAEASLLPDYESSWKKILISVTEITELKKAREALKQRDEDLERISSAAVEMELEMIELRRRIKKLEAGKTG